MSSRAEADLRWAEMLASWAIPERLVAVAPESPYFFDPAVFTAAADGAIERSDDTVSDRVARDALGATGDVLDVGVGAGAGSLHIGATRIIGVDPSDVLLDAFRQRAEGLGIAPTTIRGTWPDVAPEAPRADVVVCHHVLYNVGNLAPFARALTEHAVSRVVVELTAVHPMAWLAPYWKAIHGIDQPDRPVADDAVVVLEKLGLSVRQERWSRSIQMIGETGADQLNRIARRLCVGKERHAELRELLEEVPPPTERQVVTLWWQSS